MNKKENNTIRKIIKEEVINTLNESFYKKLTKKGRDSLVKFIVGIQKETRDTKEAAAILKKYASTGKVSKEESRLLRTQVYDILKGVGIGIPFMLVPGASVLIPFLIKVAKNRGVDLLPSGFSSDKTNDIINKQ